MESLIKKLQSLQNKTTANGCTEQEALRAAEKVAELLDKYGLSIEQLKLDKANDECSAGAFDLGSKRQTHPVVLCMSAMDTSYMVYFATYTGTLHWKTVRKAFTDGMSDRLNARLHQLTEKRSQAPVVEAETEMDAPKSYELMVLKERNVEKAFEGLKLRIRHCYRSNSTDDSAEAYLAGAEAGDLVALNAGELQ